MNIKILVAQHKAAVIPKDDLLLPIQVGKAISNLELNIQGDNEGNNISEKNPSFCELTAFYWAWKNLKVDVIGLCHYRRYFDFNSGGISKNIIECSIDKLDHYNIPKGYIEKALKKYDIILAKPWVVELSLEAHYSLHHIKDDIFFVKNIINELTPEYNEAYTKYMKKNNILYPYNMFVCKFELFDDYCKWMFKILSEAENRIKLSPYTHQRRVFGFVSERLLGIYCLHHGLKAKKLPILFFSDTGYVKKYSYLRYTLKKWRNNICFYLLNPKALTVFKTHV
jgi:hypothetical protein